MKQLQWIFGLCIALCLTAAAAAQTFPSRPITIIVPAAAGGPPDVLARLLATHLSPLVGQPVIVVNKPGAGSYLGGDFVARSTPDGYTLLINALGGLHTNLFTKEQPLVLSSELVPVAALADLPLFLMSPASLPAKNLKEFVSYAQANPGKLNVAVQRGTILHLYLIMFQKSTNLYLVEIPYNGAAAIVPAMLAGEVQLMMSSMVVPKPHIDAGKIIPLAVARSQRFDYAPDVPTVTEQGFNIESGTELESANYFAILAPAKTPVATVNYLNGKIAQVTAGAEFKDVLKKISFVSVTASADRLRDMLAAETKAVTAITAAAGIRPE
jgi:tripartite-type tricarboxylate transporter receptor subunit TctC